MRSIPRVVYWDNLPAPYAVERYNALADRGTLDFSVWFARRTDPDRSWEVRESDWRFNGAYIEDPSESLEAAHRFARRCDDVRPDLVLSLYGERPFVVGHAMLKALGIRTAVLVLPTFETWVRRAWWKEIVKAIIFRSADASKVPGPDGQRYAVRYGFPQERIFAVTQSIDVARYARARTVERRQARARVGVDDACLFLYVGRFWHGKGLAVLLDAFRRARSANRAIALWLVGDGPDEGALRHAARDLDGVTFLPFVQAEELPAYYAAADVFVFPTLGDPHGQVVEEAHAAGLPIITTDAAGDIRRRVADGTTGFVVPAGGAALLAQRMLELANDPDLRKSMGARGAQRAGTWSHDVWAADFERFVAGSFAVPRRVTVAARAMTALGALLVAASDITARAKVLAGKAAASGVVPTAWATTVARLNRLGLWITSCAWRSRRPRETLLKFGSSHGGWMLPAGLLTPSGVCYCVGVGEDTSLEDELLRRTDCLVWSFDPTPRSIAHVARQALDPRRFRFMAVGVWDTTAPMRFFEPGDPAEVSHSLVHVCDTASSFEAPCTTVAALMRQLGHDALALLKLNIEGAEWRVLRQVLDESLPVRILCVEFCQSPAFWRVAAMVQRLRRAGYVFLSRERWKFTFARQDALQATVHRKEDSHAA